MKRPDQATSATPIESERRLSKMADLSGKSLGEKKKYAMQSATLGGVGFGHHWRNLIKCSENELFVGFVLHLSSLFAKNYAVEDS